MNERIRELWRQAVLNNTKTPMNFQDAADEFAVLMTNEFIGILRSEIAIVEHYRSTSITDRDAEWHEGKIDHIRKLIKKTKEHFGVGK